MGTRNEEREVCVVMEPRHVICLLVGGRSFIVDAGVDHGVFVDNNLINVLVILSVGQLVPSRILLLVVLVVWCNGKRLDLRLSLSTSFSNSWRARVGGQDGRRELSVRPPDRNVFLSHRLSCSMHLATLVPTPAVADLRVLKFVGLLSIRVPFVVELLAVILQPILLLHPRAMRHIP